MGYMGVLTGFLITGYYAVVSGWCLQYIFASATGQVRGRFGIRCALLRRLLGIAVAPCFVDGGDNLCSRIW